MGSLESGEGSEVDNSAPVRASTVKKFSYLFYKAWLSETWKADRWKPGYDKVYGQHRYWAGAKKAIAVLSWMVLAIIALPFQSEMLTFVNIINTDGVKISVGTGGTCVDTQCYATPFITFMTSSVLGGHDVPESAKYLGIVISLHIAALGLIWLLVWYGVGKRSPYWEMDERKACQKIARVRVPVIPAMFGSLYTSALAVMDLAYVDIIDGVEANLAR